MKYIRYGYHTYFYNLILDGQCRATLYRDIMKELEISDEVTELKNYYGKYFSLPEYFDIGPFTGTSSLPFSTAKMSSLYKFIIDP